jgi:hypothetical protein
MDSVWFLAWTVIIPLNSVKHLIFVMVKYGVLFEVRTEFLNIIQTSFGFKELNYVKVSLSVWTTGVILLISSCVKLEY